MPDRLRRTLFTIAVTGLAAVAAPGAAPRHEPDHADRVRAYLDAVVQGDVPRAARAASWLADRSSPDGSPASAADAFRAAARGAAQSGDVAAAAEAAATVVAACGGCHQRAGAAAMPRRPAHAPGSSSGHMRTHQVAADRLFEGLAGPSAAAWAEGAHSLAVAPLAAGDFPVSERVGGPMAAVERRVHDLAGVAAAARDAPSRTRVYGQLLATCSQCHSRHGSLWERPPR